MQKLFEKFGVISQKIAESSHPSTNSEIQLASSPIEGEMSQHEIAAEVSEENAPFEHIAESVFTYCDEKKSVHKEIPVEFPSDAIGLETDSDVLQEKNYLHYGSVIKRTGDNDVSYSPSEIHGIEDNILLLKNNPEKEIEMHQPTEECFSEYKTVSNDPTDMKMHQPIEACSSKHKAVSNRLSTSVHNLIKDHEKDMPYVFTESRDSTDTSVVHSVNDNYDPLNLGNIKLCMSSLQPKLHETERPAPYKSKVDLYKCKSETGLSLSCYAESDERSPSKCKNPDKLRKSSFDSLLCTVVKDEFRKCLLKDDTFRGVKSYFSENQRNQRVDPKINSGALDSVEGRQPESLSHDLQQELCISLSSEFSGGTLVDDKEKTTIHDVFSVEPCKSPNPCCIHHSCLYNQRGKLCTLLGKSYIVTEVLECPVLVCFDDDNNSCKLLWRGSTPLSLLDIRDGTEVMFDAMLMPDSKKYSAVVIWYSQKPSIISLPSSGMLVFLEVVTGFKTVLMKYDSNKTGTIRVVVDGVEELMQFSLDVVFLNGKRVNTKEELYMLFQIPPSDIFTTVNKFVSCESSSTGRHYYKPICIWNGVKPNGLLLEPSCLAGKIYHNFVGSSTTLEAKQYTTMLCDVPCFLSLSKTGINVSGAVHEFELKFVADNELQILKFTSEKLYCKNDQVFLSFFNAFSNLKVTAHITKFKSQRSKKKWDIIMVQVPKDALKSMTKSEANLISRNEVQSKFTKASGEVLPQFRFLTHLKPDEIPKTFTAAELLESSSTLSVKYDSLSLGISQGTNDHDNEGKFNTERNQGMFVKQPSSIISNSGGISSTTQNLPCRILDEVESYAHPTVSSLFNDIKDSPIDQLSIDIVPPLSQGFSDYPSPSSQDYFSSCLDSPLSSRGSLSSLHQWNGKRYKMNSFTSSESRPNVSVGNQLSSVNDKCNMQTYLRSVEVSNEVISDDGKLQVLSANVNKSPVKAQKQVVNNKETKFCYDKTKTKLFLASGTVSRLFEKSGIVSFKGEFLTLRNPKAHFLRGVVFIDMAPLNGSVKSNLNKNRVWECLLQPCKKLVNREEVDFNVLLMWHGKIPAVYNGYTLSQEIVKVSTSTLSNSKTQLASNKSKTLMPTNKSANPLTPASSKLKTQLASTKSNNQLPTDKSANPPTPASSKLKTRLASTKSNNQLPTDKSANPHVGTSNFHKVPNANSSSKNTDSKPVFKKGIIKTVGAVGAILETGSAGLKKGVAVSKNLCFLYDVCLESVFDLTEVLRPGTPVEYEECSGAVTKVFIGTSHSDASPRTPATRYYLISAYCQQLGVCLDTKENLQLSSGWLPPELGPT